MKYLAHKRQDGSDKPISIYDVIKGRKRLDDIENWEEGVIYYSLWDFSPMKAVVNVTQKHPHFAFINGSAAGHHDGGESIEHSLSKKIISELKVLKIKVYKERFEIPIKEGRMESPEQFRGRDYRIDVVLQAEPCSFTSEYGSTQIAIEIKKSQGVKSRKKLALRNAPSGMVLLEISLWSEITLDDDYNVEKLYIGLMHYWNKERIAACLHNPNYKAGYAKHQENKRLEGLQRLEQLRNIGPPKEITTMTSRPILTKTVIDQNPMFSAHDKKGFEFKKMILPLIVTVILLAILLFALYYR